MIPSPVITVVLLTHCSGIDIRQYPGSQIEFIIFATELSGQSEPALRLSSTVNQGSKRMHLNIFLTEMADSALYYCALVPTVMGTLQHCTKN